MCREKHESHFMAGLLIGGLVGAAFGLLAAPFSGEKSREMVKEKLKKFGLDEAFSRISEAFEEAKKEAGRVQDELAEGE